MKTQVIRFVFACFTALVSLSLSAATIIVTNTADSGLGTLRETLASANDGDAISFSVNGTILLTSGELFIGKSVTIAGQGPQTLAVDANHNSRAFHVGSNVTVTVSGLAIRNGVALSTGTATGNRGGGILNDHATLTVSNCVLMNNRAGLGGALNNDAIFGTADLKVIDSILVGNVAELGGGIHNESSRGVGSLHVVRSTISTNSAKAGGGLYNSGPFDAADSAFLGNTVSGNGGGVHTQSAIVEVVRCIFRGNSAGGYSGAFDNTATGMAIISHSTISSNIARCGGGAAVHVGSLSSTTTLIISNCTLAGNSAKASADGPGIGGALCNFADQANTSLMVINSTLSGNSDDPPEIGSTLLTSADYAGNATTTLLNSTIRGVGTASQPALWSGAISGAASLTIGSSILDLAGIGNGPLGTATSRGYNLSSDDGGGVLTNVTDLINTDPMLGPLQDNGGPTFTHALACGSPAIDKAKNFSGSATDQRGVGFVRALDDPGIDNAVDGDGTDIGAFEYQKLCNRPPIADASATLPLVISANGSNATVVLDASRSSDPDGDLLQYAWYESGSLLANGVVAVVDLPLGAHTVQLVVDDGEFFATNGATIEVVTPGEAVERLIAAVDSGVVHSVALEATLEAALAAIYRNDPTAAINELLAFQNMVRAQVAPDDPALAQTFIGAAQQVIDALSGGNTNPGGRPQPKFVSVSPQPNGAIRLQFSAESVGPYVIEGSSNLTDWEMIGVAANDGSGSFAFEDKQSGHFPQRFYRVRSF